MPSMCAIFRQAESGGVAAESASAWSTLGVGFLSMPHESVTCVVLALVGCTPPYSLRQVGAGRPVRMVAVAGWQISLHEVRVFEDGVFLCGEFRR